MAELKWDRDTALRRVSSNETLLKELMGLMRDSLEENLNLIDRAIVSDQPEKVALGAHSIKGASANMAIEGIRETTQLMEQAARAGEMEKVKALHPQLVELTGQWGELCSALMSAAQVDKKGGPTGGGGLDQI